MLLTELTKNSIFTVMHGDIKKLKLFLQSNKTESDKKINFIRSN